MVTMMRKHFDEVVVEKGDWGGFYYRLEKR